MRLLAGGYRIAVVMGAYALGWATQGLRAETPALLAPADAAETTAFDVYLPLRDRAGLDALLARQADPASRDFRHWLTPADFQRRFGASAASVARVRAELAAHGLSVTEQSAQSLHVTASVAAVQAAFATTLAHARFSDGSAALVASGGLHLSHALAAEGALIPQFSTVVPMRPQSHSIGPIPDNFRSALGPYYAADLRQAYDYPSVLAVNGIGVTIGILISGNYNAPDIAQYYKNELLPTKLWPKKILSIPINGGTLFSATNSGETHLDIEQSTGMAPGADVALYNLSDLSNATILYGLNRIVSDNAVDIVNMSFGETEAAFLAASNGGTDQSYQVRIYDTLFAQGSAQGITFVAASGDHGADPLVRTCVGTKCTTKTTVSASSPASDPNVTAVGGTNLVTTFSTGSTNSAYMAENAEPDALTGGAKAGIWGSGGGISIFWAKPAYQKLVRTPSTTARTVPDLALHMGGCPGNAIQPCGPDRSADVVTIGGQQIGEIGTSAASPDVVGLFALEIKLAGSRLGNINSGIYTAAANQAKGRGTPFHHAGIVGNNGVYTVKAPYDAVIGNGTADGRQLLGATNLPASGIPGSTTNP